MLRWGYQKVVGDVVKKPGGKLALVAMVIAVAGWAAKIASDGDPPSPAVVLTAVGITAVGTVLVLIFRLGARAMRESTWIAHAVAARELRAPFYGRIVIWRIPDAQGTGFTVSQEYQRSNVLVGANDFGIEFHALGEEMMDLIQEIPWFLISELGAASTGRAPSLKAVTQGPRNQRVVWIVSDIAEVMIEPLIADDLGLRTVDADSAAQELWMFRP